MPKGIEIREAHFPGRAPIDAYGNGGFRFAEMSHRGSVLALPSGIHGWQVKTFGEIDAAALEKVIADAADIDVLLIGCGPELMPLPKDLRDLLAAHAISVDVMNTGAAVRTYNILIAEERAAACALIAVDEARAK